MNALACNVEEKKTNTHRSRMDVARCSNEWQWSTHNATRFFHWLSFAGTRGPKHWISSMSEWAPNGTGWSDPILYWMMEIFSIGVFKTKFMTYLHVCRSLDSRLCTTFYLYLSNFFNSKCLTKQRRKKNEFVSFFPVRQTIGLIQWSCRRQYGVAV